MRVRDLMTRKVASCRQSDPASIAVKRMWDADCGGVPVVEDKGDRVVGMITDRDVCMACWSKDRPPSGLLVSEVMSRTVYACHPDDSLAAAEALMRGKQIRRLPVVDSEGGLVGILSAADLLRQAEREHGLPSPDVVFEQVAATLASICEQRRSIPQPTAMIAAEQPAAI